MRFLVQYCVAVLPLQNMEDSRSLSIEQFQTVRQLGSGSFGEVRLVRRLQDSKVFALKSVSLGRLSQKEKENALNEIRLLASFSIPTVIKYEGSFFNYQTQELCVLMEYADGGDLQQKIVEREDSQPGQGFEENFVWKVAFEILQGLKVLHRNKVIHRDIKSANVFFVEGVAKLGDLNVSKIAENGLCSTHTGTPYYTSPEIWKGLEYGNKCDIWATGCLIYELCTLRHPFKASDFPSLFRKVIKGEYDDIPAKYSEKMKELVEMRPSASQLLQGRLFKNIDEVISQLVDYEHGEVDIVNPIKCPRMLKLLNSRLPKPRAEHKQKTVAFASRLEDRLCSKSKENHLLRKIRSEKSIKWNEEDTLKATRILPKRRLKLGNSDKDEHSDKKIEGLTFSTKRLKFKAQSSKMIPDGTQEESISVI